MKIYHHNDADGRAAGAVIIQAKGRPPDCDIIEVEYDSKIDIEKIKNNEHIYVVDFSFKPEIMEKILEITENIIWIDHHKTAFKYKYSRELKGSRSISYSSCELAWLQYFRISMPRAIELIGDRDKWAWKYGKETAYFNLGLRLYPHRPQDLIWNKLFDDRSNLRHEIIKEGEICKRFRDNFCKDYVDAYGFETEFEDYKCFALGLYMFGSEAFGDKMNKYDICISHVFVKNHWLIGLYSDKKNIDVGKIAQRFGGGGHHGASGFVSNNLPFKEK